MKDKIRIGIIGAGNIARNAHIPAYLKQENVEVAGVCDINAERAKEVADKFSIKHAVSDANDLLSIERLDAVSICTSNSSHCALGLAAAEAGKHILCEKPMAITVEEAKRMKDAAERNGIIFVMGFSNRFKSSNMMLKEMADSGRFGEIYYAKCGWIRRRGTPLGWFTNKSKSGGGPVIDIGVHVIDLTWNFMGKPNPVAVSAVTYSKIGDYKTKGVGRWVGLDGSDGVFETEDSASGLIRFENGASMTFDVSWAINGKDTGIYSQIFGTKAGANINPLEIYGEDSDYLMDSKPVMQEGNPFEIEIAHFIECIRKGKQPSSSADDGYKIQKILNGIYDSAAAGKEIML
jgi:predicted dehydrogenase